MKVGYGIMEQKQLSSLGCWTMTNTIALVLLEYDYDFARATTAFIVDDHYQSKRTTKVHYTTSGRVYIVRRGTRYYFDECMRNF